MKGSRPKEGVIWTGATKRKSEYASEWASRARLEGAAGGMKGQMGSHKQRKGRG